MKKSAKSAAIETYHAIREDIIYRKLMGGTPFVEDELAEKYQVSRTPIREALKMLEGDGMVVYYPYRGCFVKEFNEKDIVEIFTMRQALEGISSRIAAGIITDANLELLEKNHQESVKELRAGNIEKADELGDNLHNVILDVSANMRIKDTLNRLHGQQLYFNVITKRIEGRMEKSITQHGGILQALKKHDGDMGERLMREHLQNTMEDMLLAVQNERVHI